MDTKAEWTVQNKIKDSLIQSSMDRILTDLTTSTYMENMINTIVNREESMFEQVLIQRLKSKVIPKINAEIKKILLDKVTNNIQQQQSVNEFFPMYNFDKISEISGLIFQICPGDFSVTYRVLGRLILASSLNINKT